MDNGLPGVGNSSSLKSSQEQELRKLQQRDRQVRAHETAHKLAGGHLAGAARYSYTMGPDGKPYASGGEVSIDTSAVAGDPLATIAKAEKIRKAALAPAQPSTQDRRIANEAANMAARARLELQQSQQETSRGKEDEPLSLQETAQNKNKLKSSYQANQNPVDPHLHITA